MKAIACLTFVVSVSSGAFAQGAARLNASGALVTEAASWNVDSGEAVGIVAEGAGNFDYMIDAMEGVTPADAADFNSLGRSLALQNNAVLTLKSAGPASIRKSISIPEFTVSNSTLRITGTQSCDYRFETPVHFSGSSFIDRGSGNDVHHIIFDANAAISGSGALCIKRSSSSGYYAVTVQSENNTYSGQLILGSIGATSHFYLNTPVGEGVSYLFETGGSGIWLAEIADGALAGVSRLSFNRDKLSVEISGSYVDLPTLEGTGGTISANGMLAVAQREDGVLNSTLTGAFALNKGGAAQLTLGGNSSFTGGLNVNEGTVVLTARNAAGTGPIRLNIGGEFTLGPARPPVLTVTAPTLIRVTITDADLPATPKILLPSVIELTPGDASFVVDSADGRTYETEFIDSQLWLIAPKAVEGTARLASNANVTDASAWLVDQGVPAGIFADEAVKHDYIIDDVLTGSCPLTPSGATFISQANSLTIKGGGCLDLQHASSAAPARYYPVFPNLTFENATLRFGSTGTSTAHTELYSPVVFKGNCELNRATGENAMQTFSFREPIFGDADTTLTLTRSLLSGTSTFIYHEAQGSDYRGEFILGTARYDTPFGSPSSPFFNLITPLGPALFTIDNPADESTWSVLLAADTCNALRGIRVKSGAADFTFSGNNTLPSIDFSGNGRGIWKGSATLTLNQTQDGAFAATLSGALSLIKQGFATLTIRGGAIATTGFVRVDEGTLALSGNVSVYAESLTVGGALAYASGGGQTRLTLLDGSTLQPLDFSGAFAVSSLSLPEEGSVALVVDEALLYPEGVKLYFLKTPVVAGGSPETVFTGIPPRCTLGSDETGLYIIKPPRGSVITLY